ncbi:MAG: hypothetical protein WEC59_00035 [Salibacteraceae bacterium]
MQLKTLLFLFILCLSIRGLSQPEHSILLMTGKVVEGTVTGQDSAYLYYDYFKKRGKTKPKMLDLERVFSISSGEGEKRVIYQMDTAVGNYFTEGEMRYYIKGQQDAMEYYHAHWTVLVGVPVTAGLGLVLSGNVFSFAVPFVYLVATGLPKYKIPKNKIQSTQLITEPAYVLGFERAARNKRLFKSLVSGLLGTAGGVAAGQIIAN